MPNTAYRSLFRLTGTFLRAPGPLANAMPGLLQPNNRALLTSSGVEFAERVRSGRHPVPNRFRKSIYYDETTNSCCLSPLQRCHANLTSYSSCRQGVSQCLGGKNTVNHGENLAKSTQNKTEPLACSTPAGTSIDRWLLVSRAARPPGQSLGKRRCGSRTTACNRRGPQSWRELAAVEREALLASSRLHPGLQSP